MRATTVIVTLGMFFAALASADLVGGSCYNCDGCDGYVCTVLCEIDRATTDTSHVGPRYMLHS